MTGIEITFKGHYFLKPGRTYGHPGEVGVILDIMGNFALFAIFEMADTEDPKMWVALNADTAPVPRFLCALEDMCDAERTGKWIFSPRLIDIYKIYLANKKEKS